MGKQVVWEPISDDDYFANGEKYLTEFIQEFSKSNIRLCRATTVPAAASVPKETHEAIQSLVIIAEEHGFVLTAQRVRDWLSTITQEGKGNGK